MENTNLNIPNLTVNEVVKMLVLIYSGALKNNVPLKKIPAPFLWGPAGIGKSEAIIQLANALEIATRRKAFVTDVRLLLFSPVDLRGIPVADSEKKFTDWLMPRIFDMKDGDNYVNLLFLDELSAAPQSVQAAAYQICLDRKIGEHKLPDNCIVIAAGNRTTDQSVSYKMPKALCNRLMHFNVQTDYSSWFKWAVSHNIDSRIIGYLAFDNSRLSVEPDSSDMAYPTPRSWSFVDSIIKTVEDINLCHSLISACVGTDTAIEFEAWAKNHKHLPKAEDVLSGLKPPYPSTHDALYAFISSIVSSIKSKKDYITVQELENACAYINKFPVDFALTVYNDLNIIEEIRLKLMKCPSSKEWNIKHKNCI